MSPPVVKFSSALVRAGSFDIASASALFSSAFSPPFVSSPFEPAALEDLPFFADDERLTLPKCTLRSVAGSGAPEIIPVSAAA